MNQLPIFLKPIKVFRHSIIMVYNDGQHKRYVS
jgi:hypothetical protein